MIPLMLFPPGTSSFGNGLTDFRFARFWGPPGVNIMWYFSFRHSQHDLVEGLKTFPRLYNLPAFKVLDMYIASQIIVYILFQLYHYALKKKYKSLRFSQKFKV